MREITSSSLRTDSTRPTGNKDPARFRAPPPTGPRAASASAPISSLRVPHRVSSGPERPGGASATALNGPSAGSHERPDHSISLTGFNDGTKSKSNLDRQATLTSSSSDAVRHPRSVTSAESHASGWTRPSPIEGPHPRNEPLSGGDIPRGPSDRRYRLKRDSQDDDPRRLSRSSDWTDSFRGSDSSVRKEERQTPSNNESSKSVSRDRTARNIGEQQQSRAAPSSRETKQENPRDNRKDVSEPIPGTRTLNEADLSADPSRLDNSKQVDVSEIRAEKSDSRDARENRQFGKDGQSFERKPSYGLRMETARSENRAASNKDQRAMSSHLTSPRPKSEREATPRKDESKDSRHGSREGHSRRTTRRSPSRTRSERSEKRERERGADKGLVLRRENRDPETRERERNSRDDVHRRESRDRDRSSRDKLQEDRRSSRKHERDRSTDASGKHGRSGEERSSLEIVDSPLKRRRVGR